MRNSKALKPGNQHEKYTKTQYLKNRLFLWWYDFLPVRKFYDLQVFISRLKRLYHWSKFMWTNWDFDASTIYPLLEYKLKRIQKNLEFGAAVQEPKDMRALKIAIKLANRLSESYHEGKIYDWHEKKWGELKTWFTSVEGKKGYSEYHSTRVNIKNAEDKELEKAELLSIWRKEESWRKRDEKLFFDILRKYLYVWWD